jgi:hypothetical protein
MTCIYMLPANKSGHYQDALAQRIDFSRANWPGEHPNASRAAYNHAGQLTWSASNDVSSMLHICMPRHIPREVSKETAALCFREDALFYQGCDRLQLTGRQHRCSRSNSLRNRLAWDFKYNNTCVTAEQYQGLLLRHAYPQRKQHQASTKYLISTPSCGSSFSSSCACEPPSPRVL